ncbi:MAG TPA: hypothetical protein VJH37_04105 [Candidatus Nanoarchaeia archaeon]|nr:hypothetical protein [Candidatus Nanoarchaeia archaeon]
MKRGQLSTELMFLIGCLILVSLILMYYSARQISETHKISKAEDAVNHLADKVNELSSLTTGTRDTVWIDIPSQVLDVRLSGRHISLILISASGEQYIMTKETLTDVIGGVNFSAGIQQLHVTKINETTVKIGTEPMILDIFPMCISKSELGSNNPIVTLFGADFLPTSAPFADGTPIPSTFVNVATLTLNSEYIYNAFGLVATQISVRTPPDQESNSVCFHIYPTGESCACGYSITSGGEVL